MQKIIILFICLCMFSCSKLNENKEETLDKTVEIKEVKEFYQVEIAWEEKNVHDVKLNGEAIDNGEGFTLKSADKHTISWIVSSLSFEFAITYEVDSRKIVSPNTENEISGKIGLNEKSLKLTEDSYVFLDGTTMRILPLTSIVVSEENEEDAELDIFKIDDSDDVKVVDKTKGN